MALFGNYKESGLGTKTVPGDNPNTKSGGNLYTSERSHTEHKVAIAPNKVPEEKRTNVKNELARAGSDFVVKLVEEYLKVNPLSPEDLGDEGHIRLLVEASFDTVKNWFVDKVDPSLVEHQFLFEIGLIKQTKEEMYQLAMATVHASRAMKMIKHDAESADVGEMLHQFDEITRNSTISDLTKCKISREVLLKPTIDSVRDGNYIAAAKQFEFIKRLNDQLSPYESIPDPEAACAKVAEQTVYSIITAKNEQLSYDQLFELNQKYQTAIAKAKQARNGCRRVQLHFEQRESELIIAEQGNVPESDKRKAELADHYIGRSEAWLIGAKLLSKITTDKQVDSGNVNRVLEQVLGDIDIQLEAVTSRVFTIDYPILSKADLQYAEYLVDDLTFELPEFDIACIAHNVHRAETLASSHDTETIDMQGLMSMQDGPERDEILDTLEFKPVIATDTKSKLGRRTVIAAGVAASITIGIAAPAAAQETAGPAEETSTILEYSPTDNPGQAISEGDSTVSVRLSQSSVESNNKKIKTPNIPSPKGKVYESGLGNGPYILDDFVEHTLIRLAQLYDKPVEDFLTKEHKTAMIAFAFGEGGDIMNRSRFNPWNLGYRDDDVAPVPYAAGGVDGRQSYPSFDQGVEAYARQLSKGTQRRVGYILSQPNSTAKDFMYAITHYELYEGNKFWAEASLDKNGGPNDEYRLGPKKYYESRLDLVRMVENSYDKYSSLRIGTYEYEQKEGMRKPELLDREPDETPPAQNDTEPSPSKEAPSEQTSPSTDSAETESNTPEGDKDKGNGKDKGNNENNGNRGEGSGIKIDVIGDETPPAQNDTEPSPSKEAPSEQTSPSTDSAETESNTPEGDKDKGNGKDKGNNENNGNRGEGSGIKIDVIGDETPPAQNDTEPSPSKEAPSEQTSPSTDSAETESNTPEGDKDQVNGNPGNGKGIGIDIVDNNSESAINPKPDPIVSGVKNGNEDQSRGMNITIVDDSSGPEVNDSQPTGKETDTNYVVASSQESSEAEVLSSAGGPTIEIVQDEPEIDTPAESSTISDTGPNTYQTSDDQEFIVRPAIFMPPSNSSSKPMQVTTFKTFDTNEPVIEVKGTGGVTIEATPAPDAANQITKTAVSFIAAGDKFKEEYSLIGEIKDEPLAEKLDGLRSVVDSNLARVAADPNFEQIKNESYSRLAAAYTLAEDPSTFTVTKVKSKVATPQHLVPAKLAYIRTYNTGATQSISEFPQNDDPEKYSREVTKGILMIAHSAIASANTPETLKSDSGSAIPTDQKEPSNSNQNSTDQQKDSPKQEPRANTKEKEESKEKQNKPKARKNIDYDNPWPERTLGTPINGYKNFSGIHTGQDYEVPVGTPTKAPAKGIVTDLRKSDDDGAGLYVEITHPDGRRSILMHLSSIKVYHGQEVKKGQIVALSGKSGRGSGAHGHWSLTEPDFKGFPQSSDPHVLDKIENPIKFAD